MENANLHTGDEEIKSILNLLKEGDEKIKSPISMEDNVVLLIGNTGAGKSTITQFLCNSIGDLTSVEISEGDYIISDNNHKISTHGTVVSHTIIPELVVDTERGTAFYDCPGFNDTRSAGHDIAATYFIKKVVDMANQVKLLFVVNYPSVRKGVDRLDFMLLVKHALRFMKNIDKLKNSIALVVTKVDNNVICTGGNYKLITDEKVISSIAQFLVEFKEVVSENKVTLVDNALDPEFYINITKFIDALLEKDGDCYKRIGIFRRPDKPGPLSEIDLLKNEKITLEKIIHKNMIFSQKYDNDFGYSISDDSKNRVHDLATILNANVTTEISKISDKIEVYLKNIEANNYHDIYHLESKFSAAITIFKEFISNVANKGASYIRDFIEKNDELNIDNFEKHLKNIENKESNLKFLQLVSGQKTLKKTEWVRGISHLIEFIQVSQKWYYFLIHLYSMLSDYAVQKNISAFDVTNLIEQCSTTDLDDHRFSKSKLFKELLQLINNNVKGLRLETIFGESEDVFLTGKKLKALQNVLNYTLNHKTIKENPFPGRLVIKGEYIKLNEFLDESFEENITFIEIHAKNKIFIDKDVDKTGTKLQFCFISPVWEIIGDRKIVLDGSAGLGQEKTNVKLPFYEKGRGRDGKPGKAGGPAGNFLGIVGDVVGGHLYISANGGKGGPGQDGERGADAKPGQDGLQPKDIEKLELQDKLQTRNGFSFRVKEVIRFNMLLVAGYVYEYECEGKPSKNGFDGGNGGVGGRGGYGGKIRIYDLSNSGKIAFSTSAGIDGPEGKGGEGGSGAPYGKTVQAISRLQQIMFISLGNLEWKKQASKPSDKSSNSGQRGSDGFCGRGKEVPESGEDLPDCKPIINRYKNWASESLSYWVGDPSLPDFLQKIVQNNSYEESENVSEGENFDFLFQ